ncbi:Fc.00g061880.m01.CDS01 [Cosmosporella sp. VM-42]
MGFLDPWNGSTVSKSSRRHSSRSRHGHSHSHSHKKRSRSRSRSSSRGRRKSSGRSFAGSIFGGDNYEKKNASRGSFFGLGGNNSRSSFFGGNRSSYYKRSPRQGFLAKTYKHLKRLLRDLVHWAKRHPWKVFFLVIMPLVTGGALTALLARFGLRMPKGIERMLGMASKAASGDSFGFVGDAVRMASDFGGNTAGGRVERGRDGPHEWEKRTSYEQNNSWGGGGLMSGAMGGGLMGMAKKFI